MTSPFTPGKKVPFQYFEIFDAEDRGHYFWEDQPVMSESEAERLQQKYYMKKDIADKARDFAIKHEYPEVCAEHNVICKAFEAGHIAGAEAEAERAQPVIEALEHLINDVRRKPNDTRYATALNKATEALANYNSKPVKK